MVMSKENVVHEPTSEEKEAPTFLQNLQGGQLVADNWHY
jgi:hypothetical protein